MKIFLLENYLSIGKRQRLIMDNIIRSPLSEEFYQNLGRLFYAVASADRVIRKEEIEVLKRVVEKEWMKKDRSKDIYGTDTALQIEIVFDWLDANKPEAEESFERFAEFYKDHKGLFTDSVKDDLMATSNEIASAFRDKNKSELIMLAKLQTLFNH